MPAWVESELSEICETVTTFSEDALRHVIAEAHDPDKAAQLVDRLRRELSSDEQDESFAGMALCVVLGEARAESAIPLLLEAATDEDLGCYQEAAAYALQRMGMPAFEAAMDLIEVTRRPGVRVLGYEILTAAMDADADTRALVAEFCVARARVETPRRWRDGDWDPALSVCQVLTELKDERVRPFLEEGRRRAISDQQRRDWEEMLDDFDDGDESECERQWRTDWPDKCREWTKLLEPIDIWPAEQDEQANEQVRRENARLAEEFGASPFAQGLDDDTPEEAACDIGFWLDFARQYVPLDAHRLELDHLREALYEWTPRKLSADDECFERFPEVLAAFLRFLHATGRLDDPQPFLALADEARVKLPRLAADPRNWGMAKTFFMTGRAAGLAMDSQEDLDLWQSVFNHLLQSDDVDDDDGPWGEDTWEDPWGPPAPVVRTMPKIGRNQPCPCGSGKKYKKCCGR